MSAVYSPLLLDHFEHPRNSGPLADANVTVTQENPACGDILSLALKIADGKVVAARFQAKGCVPTIACGSALTELILGKSILQLRIIDRAAVSAAVGGVPPESTHAVQLAIDVIAAVLRQLTK